MRALVLLLLPAFLLAYDLSPRGACDNWKIDDDSWVGGYNAHLIFTCDHQVHGWTINIQFDQPLEALDCHVGTAVSTDQINWAITPLDWDMDFEIGDTVDIGFTLRYTSSNPADVLYADFDGPDHPICGSGHPTPPPTKPTATTPKKTTHNPTNHPTTPHTTPGGGVGDCDEIFIIETEEDGAWQGLVSITADSDVVGWMVHLSFDFDVDSIETPMAQVSGSGKEWKLHSKSFDDELQEGQILELRFKVNYSGSKPDVTRVGFNGRTICSEDEPTPPTPQPGGDCSDIFEVESNEVNGWHGLLAITAKEDVVGWEVILGFDQPVTSIETPMGTVSGSGTTWHIGSKGFDETLTAGQVLELRFKAIFSGSTPDVIRVVFNGDSLCSGDGPNPTEDPNGDCSEQYSMEHEDSGSYNVLLPLTPKEDSVGWEVVLRFDASVTSIESPLGIVSGSGTNWIIGSKGFDENLTAGQVFELRFKVIYPGNQPTLVSIIFNGDQQCDGGGSGPTRPTQPTQPTTSTHSHTDAPPYPSPHPGRYPYGEVLAKSLLFYEAERSGSGQGNRVSWRGDSGMNDAVVGGYHDAGDHVKFGFPMAAMTVVLAWGGDSFYEGYEKAGQLEWLDNCLKWSLDYFMAAHKSDTELVGQIGDGNTDHAFWGRPEDMTMARPAWSITAGSPGSDLAGETAAALASGAIYFNRRGDSSYASQLLSHARTLFDFADQHRGIYTDSIPNAKDFYESWSGYEDELFWSAAWLAKATNDPQYVNKAEGFYNEFSELQGRPSEFSWDDKTAGAQLLMYQLTQDSKYRTNVQDFLDYIWSCDHTPKGLIWLPSSQWGSLRYASDLSFITLQAALLGVDVDNCVQFAESQMNYILGDTGRSYVCGWGNNPPQRPHHRASSCPNRPSNCDWESGFNNPGPNYQVLNGAMVGGPDQNDNYVDDRNNFQNTEVATDYNAGFQSALAGLNKIFG